MGKMAPKDLAELLSCVRSSPDVLVPPMPGFDCGVHKLGGDRCIVISTDPCVNVPIEHFGWLLFHYSASDVSVFGASPQFCTVELLGPPGTHPKIFKDIMKQFCKAANDLDTIIITGHTGTYDGLDRVLGVCTAYGIVHRRKLVTPAGARPGDLILCTKPIGLEVLSNLALIKKRLAKKLFGDKETHYLSQQIRKQSCFEEAHLLAETGSVSAMHDVTEGGLVVSLNEMADASNVGFILYHQNLQLVPELNALSEYFSLSSRQILSISSTGTLLAATIPDRKKEVLAKLHKRGIDSRIIGVFTKDKKRLLMCDDSETRFPENSDDPYARIISTDVR